MFPSVPPPVVPNGPYTQLLSQARRTPNHPQSSKQKTFDKLCQKKKKSAKKEVAHESTIAKLDEDILFKEIELELLNTERVEERNKLARQQAETALYADQAARLQRELAKDEGFQAERPH